MSQRGDGSRQSAPANEQKMKQRSVLGLHLQAQHLDRAFGSM
jgi:hypothetical protein